MDLFNSGLHSPVAAKTETTTTPAHLPLAVRMRPQTLAEIVGQKEALAPGAPLRRLLQNAAQTTATSIFLWGPPGTGKTTLAYLLAKACDWSFVEVSAVTSGIKDVRAAIDHAKSDLKLSGRRTLLFIDEVHRFSKTQQDALLPAVENGWVMLVAATTENPIFSVISPLLSRSVVVTLVPLSDEEIETLLERAVSDERGLNQTVSLTKEAKEALINSAGGDGRKALTLLEAAAAAALNGDDQDQAEASSSLPQVTENLVAAAAGSAPLRYDLDQHYDVASALIKSMRGSDPDATVHYLARMLAAGEDPRFIARRLMIAAAEDVGLADPQVLVTVTAAAQAVAMVGMPEARIILSEAALAIATAPKSNAAYLAINQAMADVQAGKSGQIPVYLRDSHRPNTKDEPSYKYAHDYPHGIAPQEYLPQTLQGTKYYRPTDRGFEKNLTSRLVKVESLRKPR
ncbi:AAA family ATPase [Boudabousia tangfeifanii]|uniref:AAA family ATPase n=1 Tax=Boudabousia tangfeifanii TaxID=1912795 RepID=A0A1D9MJY0_9ACTO|nr:replication-associated recombination protein A [Boudabousia tangfeifanii]AOZ72607.1 AAA family ATPase [Boudabousia tangfeifanii]